MVSMVAAVARAGVRVRAKSRQQHARRHFVVGKPIVEHGVPTAEIMLLREINATAQKVWFDHPPRLEVDWANMRPGDSVFLPGYTCNADDHDMAMRSFGPRAGMSYANGKVWTFRSTVENGIKGVRVHRAG